MKVRNIKHMLQETRSYKSQSPWRQDLMCEVSFFLVVLHHHPPLLLRLLALLFTAHEHLLL